MGIKELQGKIVALGKITKLLDQKFVSLVRNSEKCNNMLEIISEVNVLKRKSQEQVDDMRKLEETLKLLKEKKRKLKDFYLRFLRFISLDYQANLMLTF